MVERQGIDLAPGFQRRERWNTEKQSALIESFLLNIPVPPIYLAEEADGTYSAIDGKQRLRAIADFMSNRLVLRKLERLVEAEGLRFQEMPPEITNALMLRPFLRVVTLLKQTDPQLKYEVFLRLNRGGESLNPQEIRNVAFRGPMNDTIYELADLPFLKRQLKIENEKSGAYRDMQDAEYVLRFLTLNKSVDDFSGSLYHEMDSFMRVNQTPGDQKLAALRQSFICSLERCEIIWGDKAFKRPEGGSWRDQALAGMYDAQMLAIASLTDVAFKIAEVNKEEVVTRTRNLFADDEFEKSVRSGTNTPARIKYRVKKMKEALEF
ncbi:MAG: DUF262 domain-containing protein [Betaproteobacteria bacterium]|nr:DUF262 domain-containing protein [Betaproteobacteria bacterium]